MRLALLLFTVFVVTSVLTALLKRFFNNILIKYIPAAVCLFVAIYYFYSSLTVTEGFRDIGNILIGVILLTGFAGSLLTGIFIDVILPVIQNTKEM